MTEPTILHLLDFAWKCIYLVLPALLANASPVLFKKVNFLNYPIDFKRTWNNKRILGNNKTFRGFFFGILIAIILVFVQTYLYLNFNYFKSISLLDYNIINPLILGFLTGFGVLFGDAVESLVKRRLNIPPSSRFIPWDQIDFLVGYLIFVSFVFTPPIKVVIFLLLIVPIIHIFFNHLWYWLGIEKTKW